jgi:tetratricopeptide (TPR) repeat protein
MRKIVLVIFLLAVSFSLKAVDNLSSKRKAIFHKEKVLDENHSLDFEYSFIEGIKFKMLGDYKMAIKWFNRCLSIDKTSSAVRYELAGIYILNNDYNSAMYLLRDAIKYNPHNIWYKLQLADIYRKKSMIKQACDLYNDLYKSNKDRLDFIVMQADLYASIEEWKIAINKYNKIEKLKGISEYTSIQKYKIFNKLGEKRSAEKEITNLIKKYPKKLEYLVMLSDVYILNNKDANVLDLFKKMININSENGFIYFYIADYYKNKNNIEKFKENIELAVLKDNVDINYKIQYIIKLFINTDKLNIDRAFLKSLVNKLISKYPENPAVLSLKADVLKAEGNIKGSREIILKIIELDKHSYKIWEALLLIDNQLLDFEAMKKHSEEAITYFPEEAMPYILNAISYITENNNQKAYDILSKGVILVNGNNVLLSQFYSFQAESLYNLNKKEEAFTMYDKVLDIDSDNISVLNNYSYYLSLAGKDLEKAERMISRCIELEGDNPTYMDTYAWVLFKRKRYKEAYFYMKRVIDLNQDKSSVLMEHFGDILFMNNMEKEALQAWKKAVEYGKGSDLLKRKIKEKKFIE